ncbi:50S ribosomal protein L22 [Candidatus Daviesbacteria bacterium]|nr:50S ribosomal protein L22 [Candidatus Daviesbacteria bacterium]
MEYITIQKNVTTSPRKLRLVAEMIREMNPDQALEVLQFTNKAASLPLAKAIKTAMANAKGSANLFFKKLEINEGMKLKRYRVGTAGRGRGRPYRRRWSHIKIVLTDEMINKKESKAKQNINENKVSETKDRNGRSSNATESAKGGRTGSSK